MLQGQGCRIMSDPTFFGEVTMLSTLEKVQVLQHAMKMLDINVASPRGHWVYDNREPSRFLKLTLSSDKKTPG